MTTREEARIALSDRYGHPLPVFLVVQYGNTSGTVHETAEDAFAEAKEMTEAEGVKWYVYKYEPGLLPLLNMSPPKKRRRKAGK